MSGDRLREAAQRLVDAWDAENAAIAEFVATDDAARLRRRNTIAETEAAEAALRVALATGDIAREHAAPQSTGSAEPEVGS